MAFIEAVIIKGETKPFTASIQVMNEQNTTFEPLDLSDYAVRFRVMGATTADAKVLIERVITQNTDEPSYGIINNPEGGEFTFVITAEDTKKLGLGEHPITLELLDAASLEPEITLTEGGLRGEFNSIRIVQV